MELTNASAWAVEVFGGARLGDARRTARLVEVAAALAQHTGASIPCACRANAAAIEGAYRFTRNEAVDPKAIAEQGFSATMRFVGELEPTLLLAPEDTTTLSYLHDVEELGDVGGPSASDTRGILVHSTILVDPATGRTLGLAAQNRWIREQVEYGKRHKRRATPYEAKESFKWQQNAEDLRQRLGERMEQVISVCDREADIFPYMVNKCAHDERFIVRAAWNRRVKHEDEGDHLLEVLRAAPVRGTAGVDLPQRGGRHARKAMLQLTSATVELTRPKPLRATYPGSLKVNAVLAEELESPSTEEPLSWMLLTTEPVDGLDDIKTVLEFYRARWRIEVFHKVWKTGAGVERQRMQSAANLERIAVVLASVAIRLLQLRELFDSAADVRCDQILDQEMWKLLWVSVEPGKPPRKVPPGAWAYRALARLGGWTDTKATGKVGWETLWKGWSRLQERYEGLLAYKRLSTFG
jgi:hypothetical protein